MGVRALRQWVYCRDADGDQLVMVAGWRSQGLDRTETLNGTFPITYAGIIRLNTRGTCYLGYGLQGS
jgi:L-2-hydroxyglutarate oxidase LhgO